MKLRLFLPLLVCGCAVGEEDPAVLAPVEETPAAPPAAAPALVEGIGYRLEPPPPDDCGSAGETPMLDERAAEAAPDDWSKRSIYSFEENGGVDPGEALRADVDVARTFHLPIIVINPSIFTATLDPDMDCLSNADETRLGTDPANPDTDGDGWFDGPCNERRKLVLTRIYARDEQEDIGEDELYLVADDVRHPQNDLDSYWSFDDGEGMNTSWILGTRTRGVRGGLAAVRIEGWEDDFEVTNTWTPDDLLFSFTVDLSAYQHGATFARRFTGDDDYDYELSFRVEIERFADPSPTKADADKDNDGIKEVDEARVAADLGGLADPARPEVFVEVDWMKGHPLRTQAKRQVVTQLHRNGIQLTILRDDELTVDGCVTVPEARALYAAHFDKKGFGAYRYAVLGETIWNDASGVAWGDIFLVDDGTWWINNWVLPQAGTFIHELGHTLGLTKDVFRLIDTVAWLSYDSAMNYTYQATKVDYSYDGAGGSSSDHDDWAVVNPAYGLRWSFALTTSTEKGACQ